MIGQTISHYKILEKLGEGGMGVVYKAQDLKLDRLVALKFLPHHLIASDTDRARFLQEAKAAAALNHPNICTIHEVDETPDGQLFIAMAYYEGETLQQKIANGPAIDDAITYALQCAEGLQAAHKKGITHRDIKSSNIMVTTEGEVKIMDFGLSRTAGGIMMTKTGTTVGTVPYMSPEQARGEKVDHRTDIWSLGVVMYEMIAGRLPFQSDYSDAVVYSILNEQPKPLTALRSDVPMNVENIVKKMLAKNPEARYQKIDDLLPDLQAFGKKPAPIGARAITILAASIVTVIAIGGWLWWQQSRANWARNVALPEAKTLFNQGMGYAALRLLQEAEPYISDDPVLNELLTIWSVHATVTTSSPGANIYIRGFLDKPDKWDFLGPSPLREVLFPPDFLVLKILANGYQTQEVVWRGMMRDFRITLQPTEDTPSDMVNIPAGFYELFTRPAVQLDEYWIDKYEVTNRQFKEFINQGGYQRREYWTEPFVIDGQVSSWDEAMKILRDRTGRPGPATWALGTYSEGEDEYPVAGVSWYEAVAYAAWAGKQLPTIYHWYNAALFPGVTELIPHSNFSSHGPEKVGHPLRLGWYGTYDMAGNVKEWVWNETGVNRRFMLGGGWDEPSYQFHLDDAQNPFSREPMYGFRCAKFKRSLPPSLTTRVEAPRRDFRYEKPVGDVAFATYERLYHYDRVPLEAKIDSIDDNSPYWRLERIEYAAAYGGERVPALLFLPKGITPPYQVVIFFPGASAFFERRPIGTAEGYKDWFLFIVRSGRAVLMPTYKGSYLRHFGSPFQPNIFREIVTYSGKDLGVSIDYLETRTDIDHKRIAFGGFSMGASFGPIMTAVERRFKASILLSGGMFSWRRAPEVETINFLPRARVPTLMINGRHDFFYPLETSQEPMFALLGTPLADKRHRVFDSGHIPSERDEVMKEVLDWLDKYLGPVNIDMKQSE